MTTYFVEIHCTVDVEANSKREAEEIALSLDVLDLVWEADVIGEKLDEND